MCIHALGEEDGKKITPHVHRVSSPSPPASWHETRRRRGDGASAGAAQDSRRAPHVLQDAPVEVRGH
eukprot:1814914-Prymnesium_polylepis.1